LIAKRIITVSRICGHRPTNGKSIVSDEELKTVPTIDLSLVYFSERAPVILGILNVIFLNSKIAKYKHPNSIQVRDR
jgi:hypothetical protein